MLLADSFGQMLYLLGVVVFLALVVKGFIKLANLAMKVPGAKDKAKEAGGNLLARLIKK